MEVTTGVLSRVISKLGALLVGEYKLQKEVKGGVKFLQYELESIHGALEKISSTPADQLDNQDKIWARDVRELSYDIEDMIDTFMVHCKDRKQDKQHGLKKIIDRSLDLLIQPKIRRKIATGIRHIKGRVKDVSERRNRYMIHGPTVNPVSATIDPRLFVRYKVVTDLVGVDEARDEVINLLMEGNEVSKQHGKIMSIVGFGGLGKTTLANEVFEKIREQFDCSAFASVSRTPNMETFFKVMLKQLDKEKYKSINGEKWDEGQLILELRELLQTKRYLIVIDDVWDIMVWKMIKCAFPNDNVGCKIITTTRILNVAEETGFAYKMKPLCLQNSRKLLYKRIFGNKIEDTDDEDNDYEPKGCPDEELDKVSDKILQKCAGVPLVIITISSLLASKGRCETEWYKVYNSIGTGMENSLDVENMRKILSLSYYDLAFHLRTCLLYLSMFPEDYEVEKDHLIWMWISEGFIQYGKDGKRLFEVGESYFNELINRSMIQPVYDDFSIKIIGCRVHDMMLDLLCSLSREESFVTILNGVDPTFSSKMVRRLSIQNDKVDGVMDWDAKSVKQVRSVVSFSFAAGQMTNLRIQSFKVLRVLDYSHDPSQGCSLKNLGGLFHLRYLRIRGTRINELPEEVGNLQFLETLDIDFTNISRLPFNISKLKHLLCLRIPSYTRIPNCIGSLKSLEELSWFYIDDESMEFIEDLGLLTELRVLRIQLSIGKWTDKLLKSLCKLRKIQSLSITCFPFYQDCNIFGLDAWVSPRKLHSFTGQFCWFSELPAWLNSPLQLQDLSTLIIAMRELQQKDVETLARLPGLRSLDLLVGHEGLGIINGRFIVSAGWFPCLVRCKLWGFVGPVVFQQGAVSRLTWLEFDFLVPEVREITGSDNGFLWGLGNVPLLKYVEGVFRCRGTSKAEVQDARAAVRKVVENHPNRSTLRTNMKIRVMNGRLTMMQAKIFQNSSPNM